MLETWIIKLLGPHWKSTVMGWSVTLVAVLTVAQADGVKTLTEFFHSLNQIGFDLKLLACLIPGGTGSLMKDAGSQEAIVPGEGKTTVPSHETPDNPAAIPVKD